MMTATAGLSVGAALGAGVLSFLSPCVLPLIPGYVSFVTGMSLEELQSPMPTSRMLGRVLLRSLAFVLGFSVIFVLSGAAATSLGQFLQNHKILFEKIAGGVIVVLGIHLTGLIQIPWLNYERKFHLSGGGGMWTAFLVGMAFAFGWTPCIGPILVGILGLAAAQETVLQGMGLLGVYSLGLGIPFILSALFIQGFLTFFRRAARYLRWVEVGAGLLLVVIGLTMFFGMFQAILGYLPEWTYRFVR